MLRKEKILTYLHPIRSVFLKIIIIRNIFLKIESISYNRFVNSDNKERIKDTIIYNQNMYNNLLNRIKKYDQSYSFKNKTILEIGPGNSLLLAIIFILNGAEKVYLVDRYKQIYLDPFNIRFYHQYLKYYKKDRSTNSDIKVFKSIKSKIVYFSNEAIESFNKLENDSVDFIFSTAVLEHVFNLDLAIKKIYMLLKKGCLSSNWVDLRDHFHIRDKCYLTFLCYSRKFWRFIGDTNRIRFPQYLKIFNKYKFEIIEIQHRKMGSLSTINDIKFFFHRDFRNLSAEILSISAFNILTKK